MKAKGIFLLVFVAAAAACGTPTESKMFTLSIVPSPAAGGLVTRSPNQPQFTSGTSVTLTAVPGSGFQFAGWQGDVGGTANPLTLTMDRDKHVTAMFSQVPAAQYTLAVSATPLQAGTFTRSPDQAQYAAGTAVTITATPAAGYQFRAWEGDATGTASQVVLTMDRNKTINALFSAKAGQYTLDVAASPQAGGTVVRAPNLGGYPTDATVTVTATAAPGYQFAAWQGDASGSTNPTTVTMDRNKGVTALFSETPAAQYTLGASASPPGGGSVTRAPDQAQYPVGTLVKVTATAASGYQFAGWQGDASGSANPTTVTIDRNKAVTAAFVRPQYPLTVAASPSNGGMVNKAPDQQLYFAGSTVTVTAAPASGYVFAGWQGAATGATNPLTVVMDAAKSITGTFTPVLPSKTRFVNDTYHPYSTISLKIDGVERLSYAQQIAPGSSFELEIPPGPHSYISVNGFWNDTGRTDLYTRSAGYSQLAGATFTVNIPGPTLTEQLTKFGNSFYWEGLCYERWGFEFRSDGSVAYFIDDEVVSYERYSFTRQHTDQQLIEFSIFGKPARLWELKGFFEFECPGSVVDSKYYPVRR